MCGVRYKVGGTSREVGTSVCTGQMRCPNGYNKGGTPSEKMSESNTEIAREGLNIEGVVPEEPEKSGLVRETVQDDIVV